MFVEPQNIISKGEGFFFFFFFFGGGGVWFIFLILVYP
jgi:hypothetical protein